MMNDKEESVAWRAGENPRIQFGLSMLGSSKWDCRAMRIVTGENKAFRARRYCCGEATMALTEKGKKYTC